MSLWIIAIDDAEFIDDDSWSFMKLFLDLDIIFFVLTLGTHKMLSPIANVAIKHKRIRPLNLLPVDKWYHAGLACQILDVFAIPPELEK